MDDVKFVEVDGNKFVDDGAGNPKLDEQGQPIPFIEEKTVPYERFREVNQKMRDLETEISSLKTKSDTTGLSEEQQKELKAKEYLKSLLKETLTETEKEKSAAEAKEQSNFEQEVRDALDINPDVKRAEFTKFLEEKADDYGITSVSGAMRLYREINNLSKEAVEKAKKDLTNKPGLPKSEGTAESKSEYPKEWDLHKVAEAVIAKLK